MYFTFNVSGIVTIEEESQSIGLAKLRNKLNKSISEEEGCSGKWEIELVSVSGSREMVIPKDPHYRWLLALAIIDQSNAEGEDKVIKRDKNYTDPELREIFYTKGEAYAYQRQHREKYTVGVSKLVPEGKKYTTLLDWEGEYKDLKKKILWGWKEANPERYYSWYEALEWSRFQEEYKEVTELEKKVIGERVIEVLGDIVDSIMVEI